MDPLTNTASLFENEAKLWLDIWHLYTGQLFLKSGDFHFLIWPFSRPPSVSVDHGECAPDDVKFGRWYCHGWNSVGCGLRVKFVNGGLFHLVLVWVVVGVSLHVRTFRLALFSSARLRILTSLALSCLWSELHHLMWSSVCPPSSCVLRSRLHTSL